MGPAPLVSIVIPAFNDEEVIAGALDSCIHQSLTSIEIIVVDDASVDGTARVADTYASRDPRVRVIRQEQNRSAFQARRIGILHARADHLLFLDGDDELTEFAAETALMKARETGADLVQFGIDVVQPDGSTGGKFEDRLQPRNGALRGIDVLRGLFPPGQPAQGHLWRCMYRTQLLRDVYALLPHDLVLPRVNDLPITFLAAALANSYDSVPDHLYRYYFGRGGSGQKVHDLDWAIFYASAVDSINAIRPAVDDLASRRRESEFIVAAYASARHWIIGYTAHYLAKHTAEDLLDATFAHLYTRAPMREVVEATAKFWPKTIDALSAHTSRTDLGDRPVRSILLTTNILRTGGVSGVLLSQARLLLRAGFKVTIVARDSGSDESAVPKGARFEVVQGDSLAEELAAWADVCRRHGVDLVIDHHWLYSKSWPAFALAARAENAATIGWAHNFAGRSILLGIRNLEFQKRHLGILAHLVVLSRLDVAFWKLRGMPRVSYLPNPPSPLLLALAATGTVKAPPTGRPLQLIWWGRLEQRTKRVTELVMVAAHLQRMGVDFSLRIIGPDWSDMSAARLAALARKLGVADRIHIPGPLYEEELVAAIDASDMFVNTSAIEGYPLTIPEAQSRGLPVAMYELPWLALAEDNGGIVATPQGDAAGLAERIAAIASDPEAYVRLSAASIIAAQREFSFDFGELYQKLLADELPVEFSPAPTLEDTRRLVALVLAMSEQHAQTAATSRARKRPAKRSARRASASDADADRTLVPAIVKTMTPLARDAVRLFPWLEPIALRTRHALLRR